MGFCTLSMVLCWFMASDPAASANGNDALWSAARKGDATALESLLARGVDVNAKTSYGATALWFAAYKSQMEVIKILVKHKADPNARDTVWGEAPLDLAAENGRADVVRALLEAGAKGADMILLTAASQGKADMVRALLDKGKIKQTALDAALALVPAKQNGLAETLKKAGARFPVAPANTHNRRFLGTFESPNGARLRVAGQASLLIVKAGNEVRYVLPAGAGPVFHPIGTEQTTVAFELGAGRVLALRIQEAGLESRYARAWDLPTTPKVVPSHLDETPAVVLHPQNWPSFRGAHASGVADGQRPPVRWDVKSGSGVRWKTAIPGLAHSSPIVWGDRVFITTAVSSAAKTEFRPGLYGAGTSASDVSRHRWQVYCLDKNTGEIVWQRTACEGVPRIKRHIKSSHANPTPATDGKHLIVSFASEGLYCFDLDGQLLWKQDLGLIDVGAFNDPDLQWGAASSPIIDHDLVIVQCDRHKDSFIAAYDIDTGRTVWRTPRNEFPTWSTPTVYEHDGERELITNGARAIRGYDAQTGRELWRLQPNSEIPVPAPVLAHGLIYVTSGYRPIQPIYAVRPGMRGDISLKPGTDSSDAVAWSKKRGGPYLPTPIVYGPYLYACSNAGMLGCYDARTGKEVYRRRLGGSNGYSASPVAADGKIYFTGEDGEIRVVRAGATFELLASNDMGETCMATPAISDGMIFVRTQHFLFGIGRQPAGKAEKKP